MGTTKKVKYMVANGTDYDMYAFETTSDQIKEGVLTTESQLSNGTDTQLVSAKLIRDALNKKANQADISNGLVYKGSCLYSELPSSNNGVGDFYYTTDEQHYYTWNGSTWNDTGIGVGDVVSKEEYNEGVENINNNISKLKGDLNNIINTTSNTIDQRAIGKRKTARIKSGSSLIIKDSETNPVINLMACYDKVQNSVPSPNNEVDIPYINTLNINIQGGNLAKDYVVFSQEYISSNADYNTRGSINVLPNCPYCLSMEVDTTSNDGNVYIFDGNMNKIETYHLIFAEANIKSLHFVTPSNAKYMSYYVKVGDTKNAKPCMTVGYKYFGYVSEKFDDEIKETTGFGSVKGIKNTIEVRNGQLVKVKRVHYQKVPVGEVTKSSYSNRFILSGSKLEYKPLIESKEHDKIVSNYFGSTSASAANDNCVAVASNNNVTFGYDSSKTLEEFKTYFTENPLYIMYAIADEIVTELDYEIPILLNPSVVFCNGNLEFEYLHDSTYDGYKRGVNITLTDTVTADELKTIINECVKVGVNSVAIMTSDSFENNTSSTIEPLSENVVNVLKDITTYCRILGLFVTLRCACHSLESGGGENVTPVDVDSWFTTWENRVRDYLDIVYPLGVNTVAIANELKTLTSKENYKQYWFRTINNLKNDYPNIECAINFNIYDKNNVCLDLFDIIGFNCYPCLTRHGLGESDEVLKSAFYNDIYNDNSVGKLLELAEKYPNKTIWISEIGTQSQEKGLFQTWVNTYSPSIENQDVQSKYYELFLQIFEKCGNTGMFIWSVYDARQNGFTFVYKKASRIVNKYWNNGMEVR